MDRKKKYKDNKNKEDKFNILSGNYLNIHNSGITPGSLATGTINTSTANITIGNNAIMNNGYSITTSSTYTVSEQKITLLGTEFNISTWDYMLPVFASLINFHGICFYENMRANNISMNHKEIVEYLDNMLISYQRQQKIKKTLQLDDPS